MAKQQSNPAASEYRSLLLRANRVLGASLIEHNLVNIEHLETANERLFELLSSGISQQASLLGILLGEMGSIKESDLIGFVTKRFGIGLINLQAYNIEEKCRGLIDTNLTWATWTVPFDKEDEFYFVATSYYLSAAARAYWEEKLGGQIVWYVTSMDSIRETIDTLAEENARASLKRT